MKIDGFEVRPCPYCGSGRTFLCEREDVYKMVCLNCFATGPEYRNMRGAIRRWNKAVRKGEEYNE